MKNKLLFISILLLTISSATATAGEMVYQPQNTAFGGNNASATQLMLSKAQAQDTTENPDIGSTGQTALDRFKDSLERRILDQIARGIVNDAFNSDGDILDDAGTFSTEDFSIMVDQDNPDAISVSITEFSTGSETIMEIPRF